MRLGGGRSCSSPNQPRDARSLSMWPWRNAAGVVITRDSSEGIRKSLILPPAWRPITRRWRSVNPSCLSLLAATLYSFEPKPPWATRDRRMPNHTAGFCSLLTVGDHPSVAHRQSLRRGGAMRQRGYLGAASLGKVEADGGVDRDVHCVCVPIGMQQHAAPRCMQS